VKDSTSHIDADIPCLMVQSCWLRNPWLLHPMSTQEKHDMKLPQPIIAIIAILENNQSSYALGLKPCFYNSIETQNYSCSTSYWHNDGTSKENLHLDDQRKLVDFLFCVAVSSKRNRKHVICVSIELKKCSRKFGWTQKSCVNTCLWLEFPRHFSSSQTFTCVSITR